jgi:hypothetical protein
MNTVVRLEMSFTARVGSNAETYPTMPNQKMFVCLNCKTYTKMRLGTSVILNVFNYIYFFPFSGMFYLILV